MVKEAWENNHRVFINYFLLNGRLDNVTEDNPIVSIGIIGEGLELFKNTPCESRLIEETIKTLKSAKKGSLVIIDEPEIFIEVLKKRCDEVFKDKEMNEELDKVLKKFTYFNISLDISFSDKLMALGYISDFEYYDVLDLLVSFEEYNKVKHFMKVNLLIDERIFNNILKNGNHEDIEITSLSNPMCVETFTNKIRMLDKRVFKIGASPEENGDKEEVLDPFTGEVMNAKVE